MARYWLGLWMAMLLGGCQSTEEQMLKEGYPPAYVEGYRDGCGSGRHAAGLRVGDFRKDVPRYLAQPQYETGWDDGFRQCQSLQAGQNLRDDSEPYGDERDRAWQREKNRDNARAFRSD